ncbi:MAG TPA: hypothetical protein VH062_16745 [Polyangiaceae bacterium]|jgi:hypothetical protein|nr:hypothetical protein [Polyangiaceae bacterium]
MRSASLETKALAAIRDRGALLVYPITNRREPRSLWSALYPRSEMHWAWDENADDRVVGLWYLREKLARGKKVVYAKWYRGRAVFFSRELFVAMLAAVAPWTLVPSFDAREVLGLLEESSPQSTKVVRREAGLRGKQGERVWQRSLNELWAALLLVGTGEVDDGAFPSLEIGATRLIFEDLWDEAVAMDREKAISDVTARLEPEPVFLRYFREVRERVTAP